MNTKCAFCKRVEGVRCRCGRITCINCHRGAKHAKVCKEGRRR